MSSWAVHVVKFLPMRDFLSLTATCTTMQTTEVWDHYYYEFKLRTAEQKFLNKLNYVFYSSKKKVIIAYHVRKMWKVLPIPQLLECFCTRNIISLYLIATSIQRGSRTIMEYNKYINKIPRFTKNKLQWMCSSWEILKGSKSRKYRRDFLKICKV